MTSQSKIESTEQTWNPATGCTKVSAGCKYCYAERMALRLQLTGNEGYAQGFALTLRPERLDQPLQRTTPTMYFTGSMTDLFHEDLPDAFLERIFTVIGQTPQHTYRILTKRAERLPCFFKHRPIPRNLWLGVTVEDREHGLARLAFLRQVPARIRFVSMEPLLEDVGTVDLSGIHWVIVGGESGPNARPMREEWALAVRDQCQAANVAFFFKQWGTWGPDGVRRDQAANGRLLADQLWEQRPAPRDFSGAQP